MAQTQKTIRFNKDSDRLIEEISPTGEANYNFAVNQILHRYSVLCRHLKPAFEQNEWLAICQAYNGRAFNADVELEARAFGFTIREAIRYDENVRTLLGGDPLKTNFDGFIEKIDALTIPQIIAVFQAIHEFWTPKHANAEPQDNG
jgi:hypothetical protein